MDTVPKEIHVVILDHCDMIDDFLSILQVNKYFNELITNDQLFLEWNRFHLVCKRKNDKKDFYMACKHGYLRVSKYLLYRDSINIHAYNDVAFRGSCENGHHDIAQWLIELGLKPEFGMVNIHADNECAFQWSRLNGHHAIAQWLIKLG